MRAQELVLKVLNKKSVHFVTKWVKAGIIILDKNREVLIEDTIKAMIEHSKIEDAFKINEHFNNKYNYILRFFRKPESLVSVQDQRMLMRTSLQEKPKRKYTKRKKIQTETETETETETDLQPSVYNIQNKPLEENFYPPDFPSQKISYTEAQINKIAVETKIKQIELNLKLNELIPKETAFKIYENLIFEVKANLRTLPSQIADRIIRLKTIPEIVEALTIAIDNVLIGLTNKND